MVTSAKAARNGALLLDRLMPGWATKIDVDSLDLSDTRRCVLGQLFASEERRDKYSEEWYGGFDYAWDMVQDLYICDISKRHEYVLHRMSYNGFAGRDILSYALTTAWQREITERYYA